MSYTANVYGLHPDKLAATAKLLSKRQAAKPAGSLVTALAQQLYTQRQAQQPQLPVRR